MHPKVQKWTSVTLPLRSASFRGLLSGRLSQGPPTSSGGVTLISIGFCCPIENAAVPTTPATAQAANIAIRRNPPRKRGRVFCIIVSFHAQGGIVSLLSVSMHFGTGQFPNRHLFLRECWIEVKRWKAGIITAHGGKIQSGSRMGSALIRNVPFVALPCYG